MRLSLVSLVTDLEIRAGLAHEALLGGPELEGRRESAIAAVGHVRSEAQRLLGEDLLGSPDAFYAEYSALTQSLYERESLELPFLIHHGDDAARSTRLCTELLDDVNWPYPPLLISTFSTDYYWTHPKWGVIAVPCGEERRLLGIPDLCHELGHTVYDKDDARLLGDFLIELSAELRRLIDPAAAPEEASSQENLTEVFYSWKDAWLQEFVCDLIATYLMGPAFPRQHARLRAMTQPPVSHYSLILDGTHPADHARMLVCLRLLTRLGLERESDTLEEIWAEMLAAEGETCPTHFDTYFPPVCLDRLVERVFEGCAALGLRPYDPDADAEADIPRLVNDAWRRFGSEPGDYAAWEAQTLNRLWREWGL